MVGEGESLMIVVDVLLEVLVDVLLEVLVGCGISERVVLKMV